MLSLAAALLAPALAAQSAPVTDFEGTYDTRCVDLGVNVHIGIAVSVGGSGGSWGAGADVALTCDPVVAGDETWTQVYDDVYDDCPAWLVGAETCDQVATDIADGFADVNNGFLGILPYELTIDARENGWLAKLIGIYPATFTHVAPDDEWNAVYILDNRDGWDGNFLGVWLAAGFPSPDLACVALGAAGVTGTIDRDDAYALGADFGLDEELVCVAADAEAAFVISIGFTLAGSLEGEKQAPMAMAVPALSPPVPTRFAR